MFGVNQAIICNASQICLFLVFTSCFQVLPYTECEMGMESQTYTKSILQPKLFVEKTCTQV